ncbi:MAG: hypothetical protein U5M23_07870 [Marinagarivorans sp.]|nr:hypothetical protein [Marinagarivorans sp.]
MSTTNKERLLNDLEALRYQLEQIEAYGDENAPAQPEMLFIPTLEADNIPLLGDVVPANREEAIIAHREAMAALDAELKMLDQETTITPKDISDNPELDGKEAEQLKATTLQHTLPATPKIQASIFQEYKLTPALPVDTRLFNPITTADVGDDNPFLPQHLRERLNQSKSFLLEGIAKSSESLDASTALLKNFSDATDAHKTLKTAHKYTEINDHSQLIDALVAKYLPVIESELRQQLSDTLSQKKDRHSKQPIKPLHQTSK